MQVNNAGLFNSFLYAMIYTSAARMQKKNLTKMLLYTERTNACGFLELRPFNATRYEINEAVKSTRLPASSTLLSTSHFDSNVAETKNRTFRKRKRRMTGRKAFSLFLIIILSFGCFFIELIHESAYRQQRN